MCGCASAAALGTGAMLWLWHQEEIRGDPWSVWDAGCGSRDPFWALLEFTEKLLLLHGGKGSHGVGVG